MTDFDMRKYFAQIMKAPLKGFILDLETGPGSAPKIVIYRDNLDSYPEEDKVRVLLWLKGELEKLLKEHGVFCTLDVRPNSNTPWFSGENV